MVTSEILTTLNTLIMKSTTEERTELISHWVTPSFKKEVELLGDNKALRDKMIKDQFDCEKSWLEDEMQEMDEAALKYRAKLLNIKDSFKNAQDIYVEQVEGIYNEANKTFKKIDTVSEKLENKIDRAFNQVKALNDKISYINTDRLERLLDVVDRFNHLGSEEKKLIELILKSK